MVLFRLRQCSVLLVASLVLYGCTTMAWNRTQRENSDAAYERFLREYPGSEFAATARQRLDNLGWADAQRADTSEAYEQYLQRFPRGASAAIAKERLEAHRAREEAAWRTARGQDSLESYDEFARTFPQSPLLVEARRRQAELREQEQAWGEAAGADTVEAYEQYLQRFPRGASAAIAKEILEAHRAREEAAWRTARGQDSLESYDEFARTFPQSPLLVEARRRQVELRDQEQAWGDAERKATFDSYRNFLKEYPSGPFSVRASDALDRGFPAESVVSSLGDRCEKGRSLFMRTTTAAPPTVPSPDRAKARRPASVPLTKAQLSELLTAARATVSDLNSLARVIGAFYRSSRGEIIFLGKAATPEQRLQADDWVTILRGLAVGLPPGVSIDPTDDPAQMAVQYFGFVENTSVGTTLFEADRLLKTLSTGFDNLTCQPVNRRNSAVRSELDLHEALLRRDGQLGQSGWYRYWFEPPDEVVKASQFAMRVPDQRIAVNAHAYLGQTAVPSPVASEFARLITENLEQLGVEYPALARLDGIASLVHVAKWLLAKGIPVDNDWFDHEPGRVETTITTPAITVTRASVRGALGIKIGIFGGVDFERPHRYVHENATDALRSAAEAAEREDRAIWEFTLDEKQYRAVRIRLDQPVVVQITPTSQQRDRVVWVTEPRWLLVPFPAKDEVAKSTSRDQRSCRKLADESKDVVVRGDIVVWDRSKNQSDAADQLLPPELRSSEVRRHLTIVVVEDRGQHEVGRYTISGQPAYQEHVDVAIIGWPEGECLGRTRVYGPRPAQSRIVTYVPGYGGSAKLAEWLTTLKREE